MTIDELKKELDKVSFALKASEAHRVKLANEVVRLESLLTQSKSEIATLRAEVARLKGQNPTS
jgi:chromosome segregation ATPase